MVQETTGSEAIESSTKLPTEPTTSLIEKTDSTRDERAAELVDRLSLWSGAAGLIPVPLVDVVAVWGVQLHMLRRLSEVYGVPFSENRGKSILTSLAGAMSAATAATTMTSLMKGVPIIGTAIGALTMPAVAACGTWVIGKVFMKHFASGGTLLNSIHRTIVNLLRCKRRSSVLELERQLPLLRHPRHPRFLVSFAGQAAIALRSGPRSAIYDRLADGESLRAICSDAEMPSRATVFRWIARHKEFRDVHARTTRCPLRERIMEEVFLPLEPVGRSELAVRSNARRPWNWGGYVDPPPPGQDQGGPPTPSPSFEATNAGTPHPYPLALDKSFVRTRRDMMKSPVKRGVSHVPPTCAEPGVADPLPLTLCPAGEFAVGMHHSAPRQATSRPQWPRTLHIAHRVYAKLSADCAASIS